MAAPDLLVPVEAGAEPLLGVVEMKGPDPAQPEESAAPFHRGPVARIGADVVARRKQMAGVEADAHPVRLLDRGHYRGQILEGAADGRTAARGVLEHDAHAMA